MNAFVWRDRNRIGARMSLRMKDFDFAQIYSLFSKFRLFFSNLIQI